MSEILLGTCGWSYAEWEESLYEKRGNKLRQYTSVFPTVEIDSTFYRNPDAGTVLGWARHTPQDFLFSAKLPRTITHRKALDTAQGVEPDLDRFLEVMRPLVDAEKLACILVQLPPFIRFNPERLESFLAILSRPPEYAVEFRDVSWMREETFRLLERYQVAYTIVDEPLLPPDVHVTSETAYIRWHGRGTKPWFNYRYTEKELHEWIPRVRAVSQMARRTLGYFNNHYHAYAPENCLQTMQMLGNITLEGVSALRRIVSCREAPAAARAGSLEAWTGPVGEKAVSRLLQKLMTPELLEAARSLPDTDLSVREDRRERLAAYVGETTVEIDVKSRRIIHRCPVWRRTAGEKRLCHHIAKLLMEVDSERSKSILTHILSNLHEWGFECRSSA
ncbi:MAG: DUF72 domain-containing protein [Candidatus Bathyarchaeia archaeon]